MKTLRGFGAVEHIMSLIMGLMCIAVFVLSIIGIRSIFSIINLKQFAIWGSISVIVVFIAWNIGYWIHREHDLISQIFECHCGYKARHPILEFWHKRKCLSYVVNGKE